MIDAHTKFKVCFLSIRRALLRVFQRKDTLMIVLEGVDGSGKSSLANLLSKRFGFKVIHKSGPGRTLEEMNQDMRERMANKELVVYDRIPIISEMMYGKITRDKSLYDNAEGLALMNQWLETQPMVIYCRPGVPRIINQALIKKEHDTEEHLTLVKNRMISLIHCYDDLFIQLMGVVYGRIFVYNWTNFDFIEKCVQRRITEHAIVNQVIATDAQGRPILNRPLKKGFIT